MLDRLAVDDEDNEVAEIELAFTIAIDVVAPATPSIDATPDGAAGVAVFLLSLINENGVGEKRSDSGSRSISLGGGGGGGGAVGK